MENSGFVLELCVRRVFGALCENSSTASSFQCLLGSQRHMLIDSSCLAAFVYSIGSLDFSTACSPCDLQLSRFAAGFLKSLVSNAHQPSQTSQIGS